MNSPRSGDHPIDRPRPLPPPARGHAREHPASGADRGAPLRLLRRRVVALVVVLLLMLLMLIGRLTQVQIVGTPDPGSAARLSDPADPVDLSAIENDPSLVTISVPAIRGRILDRSGTPLVENSSYPSLVVDRQVLADLPEAEHEALFAALSAALETDPEQLLARITSCGAPGAAPPPICTPGSPVAPGILVEQLGPQAALAIAERPELYPGVRVEPVPVRHYPHPDDVLAPHVLGYLGAVTSADIAASDGRLDDREVIGRAGLEKYYDEVLRGTPGTIVMRTDPRGVPVEVVHEVAPVPGQDLQISLDVGLQGVLERTLAETVAERRAAGAVADSAAAVVLDISDGDVLALASYPTYDPAVWVGGIDPTTYAALTADDSGQPLISRVSETGLPPASTFKVISMPATVAAGNPLTGEYDCPSTFVIGGREFSNFARTDYGTIDLHEAMAVSCDTLFYEAAYRSWLEQGGTAATDDDADPFISTALSFGLGERTGVDLPGEATGRIPGRQWRQQQWQDNKDRWCERAETGYPEVADAERAAYLSAIATENCASGHLYRGGDAANFSIGQGDVLTTPLQMAQVFAAIATGGSTHVPRLATALIDPQSGQVRELAPTPGRSVPLDPQVGAYLRDSLVAVVTEGTGAPGFAGFPLEQWPVAGKTGSAESGHGNDVSWFVSYAPADQPRYAVAVAITQAGLGSEAAVPVSRTIHEALMELDVRRES
ncbi:MAG: penicillin-binding transpeptidase domain-containing protein [Actinomycetia bacterium]|nr:penicillin-binding transpeptidase domain-containing protein [Actinomycetes bacterium]